MALKILLILVFLSVNPALASRNSFDLWSNVTLNLKKDKLLYHSMLNPRLNDNWARFDRQFIRNGIGYQLNPNLSLMLGHDWFFINQPGEDIDYENRIWQQIQLTKSFEKLSTMNRLRLEERFLESDFIASLRWLIRLEYPIYKIDDLDFILSNEIFVDLNKDFSFSENRVFVGLNKKFTENLNSDLGYQLRHIDLSVDSLSHALLFNLVYNVDL